LDLGTEPPGSTWSGRPRLLVDDDDDRRIPVAPDGPANDLQTGASQSLAIARPDVGQYRGVLALRDLLFGDRERDDDPAPEVELDLEVRPCHPSLLRA
jgi:hypothetical protein